MTPRPTIEQIAEAIDWPAERWRNNCHAVAASIVRKRLFPKARVARGSAVGVSSQHSWVVLGDNVYDRSATILDPTLHSNRGEEPALWWGTLDDEQHFPAGQGSIWRFGRPATAEELGEKPYFPRGYDELSEEAMIFLRSLGDLSEKGWAELVHYPMEGWPSREIMTMVCQDPMLRSHVPIDIEGMVTDLNPKGLYLPVVHKWDEEGWVTTRGLVMRGCTCGEVFQAGRFEHQARQKVQAQMRQHKEESK